MTRLLAEHRERLGRVDLPTGPDDYLFPTLAGKPMRQSGVRDAWVNAQARAGLSHRYRIHDLRHTAITRLIEAGADPKTVADIAGHTDVTITLRLYTHSRAEGRKAAPLKAAQSFDHLISEDGQG